MSHTDNGASSEHFKGYAIHDTAKYTDFKLIDFSPKSKGDYDIDISIHACGVCSSDVHSVTGGWGEPSVMPLVAGHEIAGIVTRVGSKVTEFKVGDRAGVGAQVCSCFECRSCKTDNEQFCLEQVDTYNAKYSNGDIAHGGYANAIRVHERFVFPIPDELADEDVASMFCGALTAYSPLKRHGVGKNSKVGILGLGGIGHFAAQLATALGAEVFVFSHQPDKEEDAKKMGAHHFILTSEKDFAKPYARSLDFILSTVDSAAGLPIQDAISMLDVNGHFHSVGLPDAPLPELKVQDLMANAASISSSHIGSKKEVKEMLKLAVDHGITTYKQVLPMKDVGQAIQGVKDNKVRYRYVLKQDIDH